MVGIGIVDDAAAGVEPPLRRGVMRGLLASGDLTANGLKGSVAGEKAEIALDERLRGGAL